MTLSTSGAPFRLCLFFALNPDKRLTTQEINERFGSGNRSHFTAYSTAIRHGWLTKEGRGRGCKATTVYGPGPRLFKTLEAIGA